MKKHLLALTISSLFVISANAAVSGCPSGWVKSGDGKSCVLTEKVDTPAIGTSDTTRPICINGFTYESATNKCTKTVNAKETNVSKVFPYISDFKIGRYINTTQTEPFCSDSSYVLNANKDKCEKGVYGCPEGGTLNGQTCTISQSTIVSCPSGRLIAKLSIAHACWWCNDPYMVTEYRCGNNNNTIVQSTWTSETDFGDPYAWVAYNIPYTGKIGQSFGNTFVSNTGQGCNFPFYSSQVCDQIGCTIYSKLIGSTCNLTDFSMSQYFKLDQFSTCPSGFSLASDGYCKRNYTATANYTYLKTDPSCSNANLPKDHVIAGTSLVQAGAVKKCETISYSCPTGLKLNNINCI